MSVYEILRIGLSTHVVILAYKNSRKAMATIEILYARSKARILILAALDSVVATTINESSCVR